MVLPRGSWRWFLLSCAVVGCSCKAGEISGASRFDAGSTPTIDAGSTPTIDAGSTPTIDAGSTPTIDAGSTPTIDAGSTPTIDAAPLPTECDTNVDCDDSNPCTDDICTASKMCQRTANQDVCDDGDACTGADRCQASACSGTTELCCADQLNNDGDTQTDCDDPDCSADPACDTTCPEVALPEPVEDSPLPNQAATNRTETTGANGFTDDYVYNQEETLKLGTRREWGRFCHFLRHHQRLRRHEQHQHHRRQRHRS